MTLAEKRTLRATMLAWRAALDADERGSAAQALVATFRDERPFAPPCIVAGYWPMREEIDVRPLMIELINEGCELALPVVQNKERPLLFRAWRPGDALEAGMFGTLQPTTRRQAVQPDALLVPLLACDRQGWRLGYGGGFYDRTLVHLRARRALTAVGVGFDAQFLPEVPHEPDDQRLDWLLTDRRACAFV